MIGRAAIAAVVLWCAMTVAASESLWRDAREPEQVGERVLVPAKYRLVALDTVAFRELAATQRIITLPLPDGTNGRFTLESSPIVDDALAKQLGEVRTYSVSGLDDPTATGRLDWTPSGFHGLLLTEAGTVYIDPYAKGDVNLYMSYWRHDYAPDREPFHCNTSGRPRKPANSAQREVGAHLASGPTLRTFRLAVSATGEYTAFHGGTVAAAQAAIVTTINRINAIYEREVAVRFTLVNNASIIYTSAATDPFKNTWEDIYVIQSVIDTRIGDANYDIGHLVGTGGGGIASMGVVCYPGWKAEGLTGSSRPVGDAFDVDYVAHEIGHQFNASHTFNGTTENCGYGNRDSYAAYEPGSGSTIMAYAGICGSENLQPHSDPYFHTYSYGEITSYLYWGSTCAAQSSTGNSAPLVSAGNSITIPKGTPFYLTGSATDADGDALTFSWEELDLGNPSPPNTDDGSRPIFRSFPPTTSPTRTFPKLSSLLTNTTPLGESLPATARTMTFRLTARDNRGGVDFASRYVSVAASMGPFTVTAPNTAVSWPGLSTRTVTWNVANTTNAPVGCTSVKILLSTDGGTTFPTTLLASTPNDGTENVTIPNLATTTARIRVECATVPFFDISNTNFAITAALVVTAAATSANNVNVSWNAINGAVSYDVYRRGPGQTFTKIGSTSSTSYDDATAAAQTAYLYAVRSINASSTASELSNPDLATTVIFTDPTLTAGTTLLKATHITQLRTAVSAVCALAALGTCSFEDALLTVGVTSARAAHVNDLRTNITAARSALLLPAIAFTDALTIAKALHVLELRDAVR